MVAMRLKVYVYKTRHTAPSAARQTRTWSGYKLKSDFDIVGTKYNEFMLVQ